MAKAGLPPALTTERLCDTVSKMPQESNIGAQERQNLTRWEETIKGEEAMEAELAEAEADTRMTDQGQAPSNWR